MSLQLISVLVDTAKEIGSAMYIEHYSLPLLPTRFPPGVVSSHFNPFCLQCTFLSSPLPPIFTPKLVHASVSKLSNDSISRFRDAVLRYCDFIDLHPARAGHPLRSETLDVFDGVVRGVIEELTDEIDTFVVRDMSRGFVAKRLPIEVLQFRETLACALRHEFNNVHERSMSGPLRE